MMGYKLSRVVIRNIFDGRLLELLDLLEVEFVELEEDYSTTSSPFFPRLEKLILEDLPVVKRWRKKTTPTTPLAFPLLSTLTIMSCSLLELASFPHCPRLQVINLQRVDNGGGDMMESRPPLPSTLFCPSVSPPPLQDVNIWRCKWLKSLQLASPHLKGVNITRCEGLVSLEAATATPSLSDLTIRDCKDLKNLSFGAPLNKLCTLAIRDCPGLDVLKLEFDWDSMVNLSRLQLRPMPPTENIPLFLRNRQALGQLNIHH